MTQLATHKLEFSYAGNTLVLKDLDLEVQSGELLVLLGANGSGKTTLLKILSGHLPPTAGSVTLDGDSIATLSKQKLAQRLALMPQSENRAVEMSVWQMVQLGRSACRGWWLPFRKEDELATQAAIEAVDLAGLEDRPVATLSGGQWQRAVLARSLAQETPVLLLDEPTSGLDLKHQYESLRLVKELVDRRNLLAVVSLHDLQQASLFADRIALLSQQRVFALGTSKDVLTPANIKQAYGVDTIVMPHPIHALPLIVPLGSKDGSSSSESSHPHPSK